MCELLPGRRERSFGRRVLEPVTSIYGKYSLENLLQLDMQSEEPFILGRTERVGNQRALLLRLYLAELAKDPTSLATASSRSNLMAFHHTIAQMHRDA